MPGENTYARPCLAKMFNSYAGTRWVHNINTGEGYESGRPDGFVFHNSRVTCVEVKADFGSLYLGNPENKDDTQGWTWHQRSWYEHVAKFTNTPYFIAAWVYPERARPPRVMQANASFFLVPPEAWLEMEIQADGRHTIALSAGLERIIARRSLTLSPMWDSYALYFAHGQWNIPESHPYWRKNDE
jgi:hypothetical protein